MNINVYSFKGTTNKTDYEYIVYDTTFQKADEQFRELHCNTFKTTPREYSYCLLETI